MCQKHTQQVLDLNFLPRSADTLIVFVVLIRKVLVKALTAPLRTVSDHRMDLKVTAPSLIEPNAPLDLHKLFDAIQKSAKTKLGGEAP